MLITTINILIAVGIPWWTGIAATLIIFRGMPARSALLTVGTGYGLGMGILTQWMLLLGVLKITFGFATIGLPLMGLAVILTLTFHRRRRVVPGQPDRRSFMPDTAVGPDPRGRLLRRGLETMLLVYILYVVFFVAWRAFQVPIKEWDTLSTIAFKAKIFFHEKILYQHASLPHAAYPLHLPFLMTWTALTMGNWNEQWVQAFLPFTFVSCLMVHYAFLRQYTERRWALLGVVLLTSSSFLLYQASITYRDFFMLFYNSSTLMLLLLWNKRQDQGFLVAAALLAGFVTFTKLEGTFYLAILTALFLALSQARGRNGPRRLGRNLSLFMAPSYGMCLFYHFYKIHGRIYETTQELNYDFAWTNLARVPVLMEKCFSNLFLSNNWGIVWFLLVLSLFKIPRGGKTRELKIVLWGLGLHFLLYVLLGLLTPHFPFAGIASRDVLSRVLLHFFPLATIAIILIHFERPIQSH